VGVGGKRGAAKSLSPLGNRRPGEAASVRPRCGEGRKFGDIILDGTSRYIYDPSVSLTKIQLALMNYVITWLPSPDGVEKSTCFKSAREALAFLNQISSPASPEIRRGADPIARVVLENDAAKENQDREKTF
jgi:hypothetical protein